MLWYVEDCRIQAFRIFENLPRVGCFFERFERLMKTAVVSNGNKLEGQSFRRYLEATAAIAPFLDGTTLQSMDQ